MNNATILIFGATGDLARTKLIPALYRLISAQKLSNFVVVGVALEEVTIDQLIERAKPFVKQSDETIWQQLRDRFYYQQLDFTNAHAYRSCALLLSKLEEQYKLPGNRLIYLAAAAYHFSTLTQQIAAHKIALRLPCEADYWHRIVYEKPFGHDMQSAHAINECIAEHFNEHQIYRIDHYLTKELVSNISLIRFTNCVFEPLWNYRYIDQVQIILSETNGIEGRGAYYDAYGALCDVVQNHILELLALIAMEPPEWLMGDYICNERARVLEKISVVDALLGQYADYTKERAVSFDSKTETFAALLLRVNNARWSGVPFYVKTGKYLAQKEMVIHLKFKQVDCILTKHCPSESNWLTIKVSPDATFSLRLNAKKPDSQELVPIDMEFCHSCVFGERTPDAHEVLLQEVMRGERSASVRFDEIESAWRVIDQIKALNKPVHVYERNTHGPAAMKQFEQKHGMRWRS